MNSRWATVIAASLVVFATLVIAWQVRHYDNQVFGIGSVTGSFFKGELLAPISDIVQRDNKVSTTSGTDRQLDLELPKTARVFIKGFTGATNYGKTGYYYYFAYYLFPRQVAITLDQPRITADGILGRTSDSNQAFLTNGYDVVIDTAGGLGTCYTLPSVSLRKPANPDWFNSSFDTAIAFLLPLLTALAGMWLFRLLFSTLSLRMPLLEQLAYSLGLGMMAVAALTLGVKLCGFSGRGLILAVTAVGGSAELWHDRNAFLSGMTDGFWKLVRRPIAAAILLAGLLVFLILFRLAGLQGLMEFDAVMAWALKAKILFFSTGHELVQWFSNPSLAHAHLVYPTLVPSLHAATYDSLGHVDEFVTKFWPAWMLLFLLAALASLYRAGKSRFPAPAFALLGLLLLPATQKYVQYEGGTLPMVFFMVLGFVQCALWLMDKDRARLGLGLTLLFGAAMSKLEGFIFLALVGGWMLLLPSARPALRPSPRFWQVAAFWFLAALPFFCLRVQIPSMRLENGWAGYALHHPGGTLATWPGLFLIQVARLFVNPDFANWSGDGGQFHWIGQWDGIPSLYNHSTLGLAWLCLLLTVALWLATPARRPVILWILTMFLCATVAISGVFASLVNVFDLTGMIGYDGERYLLPVLLAWLAVLLTLFFVETPSATSIASTPGFAPDRKHQKNKPDKQR